MEEKLCPIMSRPTCKTDLIIRGSESPMIICQKEKCQLWDETYKFPGQFGHCGLIKTGCKF